jgi:ATP-dependent RNA helicase DeaD
MSPEDSDDVSIDPGLLGPALAAAIAQKGYTALTPVQCAVLDPAVQGRDLRITSQTGSGKTLALGFALRDVPGLAGELQRDRIARPRALVIVPTRELARQVESELGWLYAGLGVRLAGVTGGASYREEHRALAAGPGVVVGTPGRLLDHLERGAIDASEVRAVVLDEADRMLDLGFREALESILGRVPEAHATHLVSATFPPEVRRLADSVQRDPVHIEGTRLGAANVDIDHVLMLIDPRERLAAIVNLLLADPEARTIVFARTRADVAHVTGSLAEAGFAVGSLSGEMEQAERTRALAAFKRGSMRVLVATDVAARGIDVQEVTFVLHAERPTDPDSYTHRSGRTGRAGRKGTSAVLVTLRELGLARRVLERAGVAFRVESVPDAASLRRAQDERLVAALTRDEGPDDPPIPERMRGLARMLLDVADPERTLARLLARGPQVREPEPRDVQRVELPAPARPRLGPAPRAPYASPAPRTQPPPPRGKAARGEARPPLTLRSVREGQDAQRRERDDAQAPAAHRRSAPAQAPGERRWVDFTVSWGEVHGADARRLLAMVCRRGGIESREVGGIRIARTSTVIEIAEDAAPRFAAAVRQPDPRDPNVVIKPFRPRVKAETSEAAAPYASPASGRAAGVKPPRRETRERSADQGPPARPKPKFAKAPRAASEFPAPSPRKPKKRA